MGYDVIVAGGGTAGIAAAVSAARMGAKTLVVERWGHLGGTAVYGIPFLGMLDCRGRKVNAGIADELIQIMMEQDGALGHVEGAYWNTGVDRFAIMPFEPEALKYAAQEMVLQAGCDVLFHTFITGAQVEGGAVKGLKVANKSGMGRLGAKVVVDCTGDADVAALCRVPMQEKGPLQNASILFRLGGVDLARMERAAREQEGIAGWGQWHTRILKAEKLGGGAENLVHLAGHFLLEGGREVTFTAVSARGGEVSLNASRVTGVDATDAWSLSRAELAERRNVQEILRQLRSMVPGFENAYVQSTSPIGIRESRNIVGDYTLSREDVTAGLYPPDTVATGAYPIDIHDPRGGRTQFLFIQNGGSYGIPYRCLLPQGVEGLLVAGRCLSASHEAMGSARIMGTVMAQGQAVGTAAGMAARRDICPRQLDAGMLRDALRRDGAIVDR